MSADKKRQSINSGAEGLTFESTKKPRSRKWDKEHNYQIASYRIDTEIKQYIATLAKELKISTADIAEYFLSYAIEAYKDGTLKLEVEPQKYKIKGK